MGVESVFWTLEVIANVPFAPGNYGGGKKVKIMGQRAVVISWSAERKSELSSHFGLDNSHDKYAISH
jgi:hypothetical protein